jgi:hypothetical protein
MLVGTADVLGATVVVGDSLAAHAAHTDGNGGVVVGLVRVLLVQI